MDLTVVIPFYEGYDTIRSLLTSIPPEFPVIIVDDVSSKTIAVKDGRTKVYRLESKGYFSGAVNFGIQQCVTDILVLNQDVKFKSRQAFDLVLKEREKYALIGEKISGMHPSWPMGYVHGTFMFMRRDAIEQVGLLNAKHYPLWGSTCEWQLRACRNGYHALPTKIPGMIHERKGNYGSSTSKLLEENPDKRDWLIRTPPMISVIVPTYNHGKFLPELVNSLFGGLTVLGEMSGQTFQSFDVIIADDCSTDDTQAIMQKLADPWKGLKYVRTKSNSGTSVACNLAIQLSNAKYIARIDADDMRESSSLEAMLQVQLENPHSFVYDDVQLFSTNGKSSKAWAMSEYDFDALIVKNFIHAGIMFPKKAWEEIGGYSEKMRYGRDDWAFNIALGLKGWCGVHLHEPGYLYRRHGDNRTLRNTTPAHRAEFLQTIMSLYPEAYQEVKPMACCGGSRSTMRSQTYQRNGGGGGPMTLGMPGAKGMVLVEYQRANFGDETYYGAASGATYTFSAKKKFRWVDQRDLHVETPGGQKIGILDLADRGNLLFKLARQPVKEKIAEAVALAKEISEEEAVVQIEIIDELPEVVEEWKITEDYFTVLDGVGKSTSIKLIKHGYSTMTQLANADVTELAEYFGWSVTKARNIQEQAMLIEE